MSRSSNLELIIKQTILTSTRKVEMREWGKRGSLEKRGGAQSNLLMKISMMMKALKETMGERMQNRQNRFSTLSVVIS